jgi:hypothetical protein
LFGPANMEQKLLLRIAPGSLVHTTVSDAGFSRVRRAILRVNGVCRSSIPLTIILTGTARATRGPHAAIAKPTQSLLRASLLADKTAADQRS